MLACNKTGQILSSFVNGNVCHLLYLTAWCSTCNVKHVELWGALPFPLLRISIYPRFKTTPWNGCHLCAFMYSRRLHSLGESWRRVNMASKWCKYYAHNAELYTYIFVELLVVCPSKTITWQTKKAIILRLKKPNSSLILTSLLLLNVYIFNKQLVFVRGINTKLTDTSCIPILPCLVKITAPWNKVLVFIIKRK